MPQMTIPRRKLILVLCEGKSERGYAALLQRLADAKKVAVHIDSSVIKSGDPSVLVDRAIAEIELRKRRNGSIPEKRFLMLDTDLLGDEWKRQRINQRAKKEGIKLVRQQLCFEAFLLRHFEGHEDDDPATSAEALKRLQKVWPNYHKGASAADLAKMIGLEGVQRAAKCRLNKDIIGLLDAIGLVP